MTDHWDLSDQFSDHSIIAQSVAPVWMVSPHSDTSTCFPLFSHWQPHRILLIQTPRLYRVFHHLHQSSDIYEKENTTSHWNPACSPTYLTVFLVLLSDTNFPTKSIWRILKREKHRIPKNFWYMFVCINSLLSHRSLLSFAFSFFDLIFLSVSVKTSAQLARQHVSHSINQSWEAAN